MSDKEVSDEVVDYDLSPHRLELHDLRAFFSFLCA
jgi:hypothetical protein